MMCEEGFLFCCCSREPIKQNEQETTPAEDPNSQEMAAAAEESPDDRASSPGPPDKGSARGGQPDHLGPVKQLHSNTGHNLAISLDGEIYGSRELFSNDAILEITSSGPAEVQIKGKTSQMFVAMNSRGKVYAEDSPVSPNIIWEERYDDGWNSYVWKGHTDADWFLGIKRSGKPKRGNKTRAGQKAVRFMPRSAYPKSD